MGNSRNSLFALVAATMLAAASVRAEQPVSTVASDTEIRKAFAVGLKGHREVKVSALEIERSGSSVMLSVVSVDSKETVSLKCPLCTPTEMLSTARNLGALWAHRTEDRAPARIEFSDTEGARIWVDGIPAEPVNSPHPIADGPSAITAETADVVTRGNIIASSGNGKISVSTNSLRTERPDRHLPAAIIMAGLGWSAAVTGGIFLSMHNDCSDDKCRYRYDLKTPGIISIAAAVLFQAAAGVLLGTADFVPK